MGFKAWERVEYTDNNGLTIRGVVAGNTGHEWPDTGVQVVDDVYGRLEIKPAKALTRIPGEEVNLYYGYMYLEHVVKATNPVEAKLKLMLAGLSENSVNNQNYKISVIPNYLKTAPEQVRYNYNHNHNVDYYLNSMMQRHRGNPTSILRHLAVVFEARKNNKTYDTHGLFEEIAKTLANYANQLAAPVPKKPRKPKVIKTEDAKKSLIDKLIEKPAKQQSAKT